MISVHIKLEPITDPLSIFKHCTDPHFHCSFVSMDSHTFNLCIVDDASLIPEAYVLPLFRLGLNTLVLIGDDKMHTLSRTNKVRNKCS